MLKLLVQIKELRKRRKIYPDTNWAAVVEHCIVQITQFLYYIEKWFEFSHCQETFDTTSESYTEV